MTASSVPSRRRLLAVAAAICAALVGVLPAQTPLPPPDAEPPTPAPSPRPAGPAGTPAPKAEAAPPIAVDEASVFCPVCGTRNRAGSKFCLKDGTPLPAIDPALVLTGFARDGDTLSQQEIQQAVHRASASVVRIRAKTASKVRLPVIDRLEDARVRMGRLEIEDGETRLIGSGFVVGSNGEIVTNAHVASPFGAQAQLNVDTTDGRSFPARLLGIDYASDLALMQVDTSSMTPLVWGDSDELRLGEETWAIGDPLDVGLSVTRGTVATLARVRVGMNQVEAFLHSDAYITHGNSGGPLVDTRGRVVGISDMGFEDSKSQGYSIASRMAKLVVDRLQRFGRYDRGFVGLHVRQIDADSIGRYHLKRTTGVVIESVLPGTPAESAGFHAGDVLYGINGRQASSFYLLQESVSSVGPSALLTINTDRGGQAMEIKVTTALRPAEPHIDALLDLQSYLMLRFEEDARDRLVHIKIPQSFSPASRYGFLDDDIVQSVLVAQDWPDEPITYDYYKKKAKIVRITTLDDLRAPLRRMYLGGRVGVVFELKRAREPIAAVAYDEIWPIVF